jgi:uncharacterized protein
VRAITPTIHDELSSIPAAVQQKLGHYVYLYVDPRTDLVFYVGKGQGNRALAHLDRAINPAVCLAIRQIHQAGFKVRIDILKHGLSLKEALETEAAAIEAYGLRTLKNSVRGHLGESTGRVRLSDLVRYYEPRKAVLEEPCILIRINQTYKPGMSALELYEATRGIWRISRETAKHARYALAVYDSSVLEAYELTLDASGHSVWFPAGSTAYFTRFLDKRLSKATERERFEFVGRPVKEPLRKRLVGRLPANFFPRGAANPIQYSGIA